MHLFHHFLMVEIMFSEADFGAESGISQHNGPIISSHGHWFGILNHDLRFFLQEPPDRLKNEEQKKMALTK